MFSKTVLFALKHPSSAADSPHGSPFLSGAFERIELVYFTDLLREQATQDIVVSIGTGSKATNVAFAAPLMNSSIAYANVDLVVIRRNCFCPRQDFYNLCLLVFHNKTVSPHSRLPEDCNNRLLSYLQSPPPEEDIAACDTWSDVERLSCDRQLRLARHMQTNMNGTAYAGKGRNIPWALLLGQDETTSDSRKWLAFAFRLFKASALDFSGDSSDDSDSSDDTSTLADYWGVYDDDPNDN